MEHVVVAEVVRSGLVEGYHWGSAVALAPDGAVRWSMGTVDEPIFPRSSNKPVQATGMVRAGLRLRGRLLALACASHSGEGMHIEGAREILAGAGLDESALQTPAELPVEESVRLAYVRGGGEPAPVVMNCSGKHAAMLATCVVNGWDVQTYLDPSHPVQQAIRATFEDLTGEPDPAMGVDGCGAPLLACSLIGLARAFGRIQQAAAGTAERAVADAISGSPEHVSGTQRDEALLLHAYPGAIAKAGAEACYAVSMPDGTSVALKIGDGGSRARPVLMAAILRHLGYDHPVLAQIGSQPLFGAGRQVGHVRAVQI
ncbi:MAG: asparaginase [Actinomycetota bacterium]|nr:asparaginase [Actinomycetota bacterium]